jgi:hypothetical protein
VSCGGGTHDRSRSCTNPAPQHGGCLDEYDSHGASLIICSMGSTWKHKISFVGLQYRKPEVQLNLGSQWLDGMNWLVLFTIIIDSNTCKFQKLFNPFSHVILEKLGKLIINLKNFSPLSKKLPISSLC